MIRGLKTNRLEGSSSPISEVLSVKAESLKEDNKMNSYKHILEGEVYEPSCTETLTHTGYFIYYYDQSLRLWTVLFYSDDGIYVSKAEYYNNKEEVLDDYAFFKFIKEDK